MPNLALVVGVAQYLPACENYRTIQNQGAGHVCVTPWFASCATIAGEGEYLKPDSTPGPPPVGDGGIWDSETSDTRGELRLETFGANSLVHERSF
jgi:hypothetical protein